MGTIVFSNRVTGRMLVYIAGLGAFGGALTLYIDEGKNIPMIVAGTIACTALAMVLFWLAIHFSSRTLIAELIRQDDVLKVEMVHILGKGSKFELAIPPASDWSWQAQKTESKSNERYGIITVKAGGKTYQMSLNNAKVVDEVELRKLAPATVDELIASKLLFHKPA